MAVFDCDLFVIGGGSGGVRAARIAAGHGAKVMLAEEFRMGGTCVIRGCVPKKLYVLASRFADGFSDATGFGWERTRPEFHWDKLVSAKESEITRLEEIYAKGQAAAGVEVIKARAEIRGAHEVSLIHVKSTTGEPLPDRTIRAKHILIATGGTPIRPMIAGAELAISSNEIFDLPVFPKRLIVVGGGYIAVEFAGIFSRLGADVTLIHRGAQILRGFDGDVQSGLREAYMAQGINLRLNEEITALAKTATGISAKLKSGGECLADQVLFATGRAPNIAGLGLEDVGVACDKIGAIVVNAHAQTSVPSIYAVGDVTNRVNLTPVAIREGHAFADSTFGNKPWHVNYDAIATAVFSTPEIGTVGISEEDARTRFKIVDIYRTSFRPIKATLSGRAEKVMMKIVVDGSSDRVLGVHILGEGAGEMAQLLGIAVKMHATKADFDETMAVHPTAAEELVTMRTRTARYENEAL